MIRRFLKEITKKLQTYRPLNKDNDDAQYLSPDVPLSKIIAHQKWQEYLYRKFNKPGLRILEIGSREVTSASCARERFHLAEYTGFDFYEGSNVDIAGDAHKLSSYFRCGEKFDLIFSSACFEHFAMPWVVATEIAKMLKIGGHVFIETHFSYSSHERPWHFFQFSDMALRVLFSRPMGFQCIEAGMSNPIVGRFSDLADNYLRYQAIPGLYCHSEYLGKKIESIDSFAWDGADLDELLGGTRYPEPPQEA